MQQDSQHGLGSSSDPSSSAASTPAVRMRTACAYGNFEQLREVAEELPELLNQPDELGYFPLQWAALNNRTSIVAFLIDKGVDLNRCTSHRSSVQPSLFLRVF